MALFSGQFTGSNFAYQHLPFDTFLDDAADLGREKLELWGIAPHLHIRSSATPTHGASAAASRRADSRPTASPPSR